MRWVALNVNVFSGIREPDAYHPELWAAVGVSQGDGIPDRYTDSRSAIEHGVELIVQAAQHPDVLFAPELLELPENGGLPAQAATSLGLQMIASGVKAALELGIWAELAERGWTDQDRDRFIDGVSQRMYKHNPVRNI